MDSNMATEKADEKEVANRNEEKRSVKIMKTVLVYAVQFSVGYFVAILGPCLLDFQLLLSTTLQTTTLLFTSRSSGYLIGSFLWGASLDKYDNQLILGICLLGAAISVAFVPWCSQFVLIVVVTIVWGFFTGGLETGGNIVCLKIWGEDAEPVHQGLYFSFALGSTLAPLLAGPFLTPIETGSNSTDLTDNITQCTDKLLHNMTTLNDTEELNCQQEASGELWVPFTILACIHFLLCIPYFIIFMRDGCSAVLPKSCKVTAEHLTTSKKNYKFRIYKMAILVLLFLLSFFYISHEVVYGGFIFTFSVEYNFHFSVKEASYLNSAFWGSYAVARALGIPTATVLSPRTMLIIDFCGLCTASTLLASLGGTFVEVLWGATILLGFSMGTFFSSTISWGNRYIELTGKSMATFTMAAALAEILLPWFVAFLVDQYDLMMVMYVTFSLTMSATFCYIIMQIIGSCHGERSREVKSNGNVETGSDKDNANTCSEMAIVNTSYVTTNE